MTISSLEDASRDYRFGQIARRLRWLPGATTARSGLRNAGRAVVSDTPRPPSALVVAVSEGGRA